MKNRVAKYFERPIQQNRIKHLLEPERIEDLQRIGSETHYRITEGTLEVSGETRGQYRFVTISVGDFDDAWLYDSVEILDMLRLWGYLAADPTCPVSWYQAALLTKVARQLK